jgi:HPt (histidine-containing phosphotransfer) domain-containing protein
MSDPSDIEQGERACDGFALYVDLLGPETALRGLDALEAGLRSILIEGQAPGEGAEPGALSGEVHSLISAATTVGFLPVARACQAFEASCGSGAARAAFARARRAAVAAVSEIARLRSELQTGSSRGGEHKRPSGYKEGIAP